MQQAYHEAGFLNIKFIGLTLANASLKLFTEQQTPA